MKKKSTKSAFFYLRALFIFALVLGAITLAFFALPSFAGGSASPTGQGQSTGNPQRDKQKPDVVRMIGPVSQNQDLRAIPYIPANTEHEERRLTRYPFPLPAVQTKTTSGPIQQMLDSILTPSPNMPSPVLTFDAIDSSLSGCGC